MSVIKQSLRRPIQHTVKRYFSSTRNSLKDSHGRQHDYLRLSLTERCNLRCKYCMPKSGVPLTNTEKSLSLGEVKYLTRLFVESCGVKKIRLTGGEPTIDRKLFPILDHLKELRAHGLKTIAMTTNGLTLKARALQYRESGIDAVNISLDTLKADKFESITRRKGWKLVNDGLARALEVDFVSVKLNCVVIRGFNDDELVDFAQLAMRMPIEVRFIEFMPFMGNKWAQDSLITYEQMLKIIKTDLPGLEAINTKNFTGMTSKTYKQAGMIGSIGFISSMTDNFCSGCNRLRLTSDGSLKVCLFDRRETSLRDLLRNGATEREIIEIIQRSLMRKKKEHAGMALLQRDVSRPMVKIAKRALHSSAINRLQCDDDEKSSSNGSKQHNDTRPISDLSGFSHLDNTGQARMVNVGVKERLRRVAVARGEILIGVCVLDGLLGGSLGTKGDILSVAKTAGIMAAKSTCNLIPMCHQISLDHISVDIEPRRADGSLIVTARVEAEHKTGVELECMTAVSVSLLTIYDMCKSVSRDSLIISNIRLVEKRKTRLATNPIQRN